MSEMYDELTKRLNRYSENCVAYKLDADFADAVQQAADAIEELQKALNAVNDAHNEGYDVGYWAGRRDYEPKWIPVTERLPDQANLVLIRHHSDTGNYFYGLDVYDGVGWVISENVTHWMPLPEPPKEERKDADC